MLLEEWPWWDDDKEGKSSASKTDVKGELDVLGDEADEERDSLFIFSQGFKILVSGDILRQ